MRDGLRLRADVFRPTSGGRVPVIMCLGTYQKDKLWGSPDTVEEKPNSYMVWNRNPLWWVPKGYAIDASTAAALAGRPAAPTRGRWTRPAILRRDRVGGASDVVQRRGGPARHFLLRDDAMAGRQIAAHRRSRR